MCLSSYFVVFLPFCENKNNVYGQCRNFNTIAPSNFVFLKRKVVTVWMFSLFSQRILMNYKKTEELEEK